MSAQCFFCQGELEEFTTYADPFDANRKAHVCNSCHVPSNMVIYTGEHTSPSYPRGFLSEIHAFDAEDSRHCVGVMVFYSDEDTQYCGRCDESFYGSMTFITDDDAYWCTSCADNHAHWCEVDEEYYSDADNMPSNDDDEGGRRSSRQNVETDNAINGFAVFRGNPTPRFMAAPLVGIEFEHAPVRAGSRDSNNDALFLSVVNGNDTDGKRWREKFVLHGDGSIKYMEGYGSSEIVSMPASGDQLERIIRRFYQPFADGWFTPGPEHHSCGFHMHVASEYLFMMKRGKVDENAKATSYPRALLAHIHKICNEFVSSSRRENSYCSSPPGIRDKNMGESGVTQMCRIFGKAGYPAVSVRSFGTIEFRIWPSSNSIRNTLARAELSQKLVAWWDSALVKDGEFVYRPGAEEEVSAIANMCSCGKRRSVPDMLHSLLDLSPECLASLRSMSERFSPFSHGKTMFKFLPTQLMCLDSELTEAGLEPPKFGDALHAGDTTVMMADSAVSLHEEYLAFGVNAKCYDNNPEMVALVAQLAKGEA